VAPLTSGRGFFGEGPLPPFLLPVPDAAGPETWGKEKKTPRKIHAEDLNINALLLDQINSFILEL